MSKPVMYALAVETILLLATFLSLVQPEWLARSSGSGEAGSQPTLWLRFVGSLGVVFLSLTFCWSVILGAVLVLNGYRLQLF